MSKYRSFKYPKLRWAFSRLLRLFSWLSLVSQTLDLFTDGYYIRKIYTSVNLPTAVSGISVPNLILMKKLLLEYEAILAVCAILPLLSAFYFEWSFDKELHICHSDDKECCHGVLRKYFEILFRVDEWRLWSTPVHFITKEVGQ